MTTTRCGDERFVAGRRRAALPRRAVAAFAGTARRLLPGLVAVLLAVGLPALPAVAIPAAVPATAQAPSTAPASGDVSTTASSGPVEITIARAWTGTGNDTAAACALNRANGYEPGDESAEDDQVCMGDTVGYRLTFAKAETTDWSTVRVEFTAPPGTRFVRDTWNAMCQGGGSLPFQGVRSAAQPGESGDVCEMTFAPEASSSLSSALIALTVDGQGEIAGPTLRIDGGSPATGQSFRSIAAPRFDLRLDHEPQFRPDRFVTRDGVTGMEYTVRLRMDPLTIAGYHRSHGLEPDQVDLEVDLDLTGFPEGTTISGGGVTTTGDRRATVVRTVRAVYGGLSRDVTVLTIFTPGAELPDEVSTFGVFITGAAITSPTDLSGFGENLRGAEQPGLNGGKDVDTGPPTGAGPGLDVPNNDWALIAFDPVPSGGVLSRHLARDLDGMPGGRLWDHFVVRPDEPIWSVLELRSYAGGGDLLVCEAPVDMSYGGHVVDASRVPYLEVWDESAGAFVPGTGLTVEYASAAECGDPGSSDGWSDTPTASPGAVRVRVEDLSLAVANTVAARIALPYVVQPASQLSRHPEPTLVKDVVSGVWNPHPGASWSNGLPAGCTVQGISLDVTQTTQMRAIQDDVNPVGHEVTEIGAGRAYWVQLTSSLHPQGLNGGTAEVRATWHAQLDRA